MSAVLDATLRRAVREADPVGLLRALVRSPSHSGLERQEEQVARGLAAYLEARGLEVSLREVQPGRPNLIARMGARGRSRSLLLCGHTDTVPPNAVMEIDPFAGEVRDGRLYGRGACDMKGALAAMAAALAALARHRPEIGGEVRLAAVIDEEHGSLGAEDLIRSGLSADGCVVGEPTENRVAIGHRGLEWLEAEFIGRATHGGGPGEGVNAIAAAARFLRLVEEGLLPDLGRRSHPLLGPPTLNVGVIHGGDQPNTVPARCTVQMDRRWVPGETVEQVFADLEDLLTRVRAGTPGLTTALKRVPGGMATMVHGPLETPREHPLVEAGLAAREEVSGERAAPGAFPAWTDAALLSREAGIPCVVMGPGHLKQAHSADEWVSVAQVEEAALLYTALALRFATVP